MHRTRLLFFALGFAFVLLTTTSSHASDWPQFRGPTGLGYVTDKNLPLTWNAKSNVNIAWKAALPKSDNPYSSPVVSGDRVFVTSAVNNPVEHHVLCFARADGKLLWDTTVEPGPWILKDLRGGYGAPTPCTDGKNVFVVFGSAVIASLDFDGKVVWRKPLQNYNFDVAMGSSPILHKDTVILDCDQNNKTSSFIAFDKATGDIKWEQKRPQAIYAHSTPVIVDVNGKPQMLVSANKAIESLNPDNGEMIWWCAAPGDASSPAYARNLVFSDSGRGGKAVLVEATGTGDVSKTHLKWTFPQIPEGLSSAIIVGDFVFRTHNPESLKCLRLSTGEMVFTERLPGVSTWASPFATPDGTIYFASAGKSYVIKAGDKLEILATNDIGEENRATAAVADGKIFLRGNKNLYCLGKTL
jgi:outer membrane protein assembly factor BamB